MNLELTLQLITSVLQNSPYLSIFTAVVTLASAIAASTPTPKKGSVLGKAYRIVDILALNIGKAKDKGQ
jgi:hypothetical protein